MGKNDVFQKVIKCPINIADMLTIKYLNTLLLIIT